MTGIKKNNYCSKSKLKRKEAKANANRKQNEKNWAELDQDILSIIFMKVGALDILEHVQFVCKPWQNVSLSPQIWKVVNFATLKRGCMLAEDIDLEKMTREAVDRSKGQMEELWIDSFGSDDLMSYVADRTSSLKRLHLISVNDIDDVEVLIDMLKRQPQLEELEITFGNFDDEILEEIGKACSNLRCFRYNQKRERFHPRLSVEESDYDSDMDANDIANNMPELRVLQLVGISLTNKGLAEILGKCKHLESLDICYCFGVNVNAYIKAKAERLKEFKLPDDAIYYEYLAEVEQLQLVLEPDDDLDDPWYNGDI